MESNMLNILNNLPPELLTVDPQNLHQVLSGPTLIHLQGRRENPLFISVLLHGNEVTGFYALQSILKKYQKQQLPRSLSIFIGNVSAARFGYRRFENQPDYNRIWKDGNTPEHAMAQQVLTEMRQREVFASIDIHNNTGFNPHYACVTNLDQKFLHLANYFSRIVVYFRRPDSVLSRVFSSLSPSVTVECGQPGNEYGISHAAEFIDACLHLSEFPNHLVPKQDINVYHTVATVRIPANLSFGFKDCKRDICFIDNLDHLNFQELPTNTLLGKVNIESKQYLNVVDEAGNDVTNKYFKIDKGEIRTVCPVIPAMLSMDEIVIQQDCLGYLMESLDF
jgi:succinylglutamate desuccinylase